MDNRGKNKSEDKSEIPLKICFLAYQKAEMPMTSNNTEVIKYIYKAS